jgi:uncharacterized protein (TIGR02757 family)
MQLSEEALAELLNEAVEHYENPAFITEDPICIPHSFQKSQDIEISAFFASILAWGNRTTIIKKTKELMHLMGNTPHDFVLHHSEQDLKGLLTFKHRTFQTTDLLYFIDFLKRHYTASTSLETAFTKTLPAHATDVGKALEGFEQYFSTSTYFPERTRKHISSPARHSACKRLNMFLRWMVRSSQKGVDFGLWKNISPSQLVCPCDVHVAKVAKKLHLIEREPTDWKTALELTEKLRFFDAQDPVKYDFALFGMGRYEM